MTVYRGHPFSTSGYVDPTAGGLPPRHVRDPAAEARHAAAPTPPPPYTIPSSPAPPASAWSGFIPPQAPPLPPPPPRPSPVAAAPSGDTEDPGAQERAAPRNEARKRRITEAQRQWDEYPWADDWLRLAEDLFWVMQRDRDGKLLVHPRVAGLGLAAALLIGMLLTKTITLRDGALVADERRAHDDGIAARIVTQMLCEPAPLPAQTWLKYLAEFAYELIAQSLVHARQLRVYRRLLRPPRYEPVSMNDCGWARARLSTMVGRGLTPDPFETALCGLLFATDLDSSVLADGDEDAVQNMRTWVTKTTPDDVLAVLHALEAAVGTAAVTAT